MFSRRINLQQQYLHHPLLGHFVVSGDYVSACHLCRC